MMSGNNNFLLKIHMEDEENTTEIYLNKERRSFTFINDECISDLVIPEFKITSLNMILQNVSDDKGDDSFYAEYEKNNEIVREYDKEKITILSNMITKISINDFLDYQKDIKINEYYVDNIVDTYDCVLPTEIKKIVSYTTNGVVFNDEEIIYFLPHEDIVSYDGSIKNFIPLMIRNGKNYIGYDFKESIYKEYEEERVVKEAKKIDDLIEIIDLISVDNELNAKKKMKETTEEENNDIEIIGDTEEKTEVEVASTENDEKETDEKIEEEIEIIGEESDLEDEKRDLLPEKEEEIDIEKELEKLSAKAEDIETQIARIDEEYENTIKNIDYQFERLNNGIIKKEEKTEYQFKEKKVEPKKEVAEEQNKKEKIAQLNHEIEKLKYEKAQASKVVQEDEIGEEAELLLNELDKEVEKLEELKEKVTKENIELPENIEDSGETVLTKLTELIGNTNKIRKTKKEKNAQINHEIEKLKYEKAQASKVVQEDEIGEEAELLLNELDKEVEKLEDLKGKVNKENIELPKNIEDSGETILTKLTDIIEKNHHSRKNIKEKNTISIEDEIRAGVRKSLQELENTNDFIDEIDKDIAKVIERAKEIKENKTKEKQDEIEINNARLDFEIEKLEYERKQAEKLVMEDGIGKKAEELLEELTVKISKLKKMKLSTIKINAKELSRIEKESNEVLNKLIEAIKVSGQEKKEKLEKIDQINHEIERIKYEKKQAEKIIIEEEIGKTAEELLEELNFEIARLDDIKSKIISENIDLPKNIEDSGEEILNKLASEIEKIHNIRKTKKEKVEQINQEIEKLKYEKAQASKVVKEDEIGEDAEKILQELDKELNNLKELKGKVNKEDIDLPKDFEDAGNIILFRLSQVIERTNDLRKSRKEKIEQINHEIEKIKHEKKQAEKVVKEDEIGKEAENILVELNKEIEKLEELKEVVLQADIDLPKDIEKSGNETLTKLSNLIEKDHKIKQDKKIKIEQVNHEIEKLNYEKKQAEKIVKEEKIGKEAEIILNDLENEIKNLKELKEQVKQNNIDLPNNIEDSGESILLKLSTEIERITAERKELKRIRREKKEKQEKEEKNTILSLNTLINNSINNSINNYKINLNDTKIITVEHLPYYELKDDFSIIQIPEIELGRLSLNPTTEIDLDKLKLKVVDFDEEKVKLYIQTAAYIVDNNNNKIKKGDYITLKYNEELVLRLNKKNAMENWTLKMEKSTFEREIRNIDFHRIMNILIELDLYKDLGKIEKYELKKSVMLFLDFVMKNKDYKVLEKLYSILEKNPKLYEEHITKYNIENSLKLKDSLPSYEAKKSYYTKLNYINGLIDAKWLDYPRYIFNSHNYFSNDGLLEEFIDELDSSLEEKDFYDYLMDLFDEYEMFKNLDIDGKESLHKCIEYLSVLYKYQPELSEDNKYKIERTFMIGATEEEMALLISKLCRRGIKDYANFMEYDAIMKERYTIGNLKYPIYSEYFELEEIRNGGEFDEFEN